MLASILRILLPGVLLAAGACTQRATVSANSGGHAGAPSAAGGAGATSAGGHAGAAESPRGDGGATEAGAGSQSTGLPLTVANPRLADVCANQGKLEGVRGGVCPLRSGNWEWDVEATLYPVTAEQSSLPACAMAEEADLVDLAQPGWRLTIDKSLGTFAAGASPDHFNSVFVAARRDVAVPCAVRLVWKLKQQAVRIEAGTVLRYARRQIIRNVEDEVSLTTVVHDDQGQFVLGYATGVRPETWEREIWPEVSLSVDQTPVCQDSQHPNIQRLSFTLSAGEERCTLEASAARCCVLGGKTFLVQSPDAARNTSVRVTTVDGGDAALDSVSVLIAREGVLVAYP